MSDAAKASKTASSAKIFDRLTILVVNQELLISGSYGPVTAEQKAVLEGLVARSNEVAALVREVLDS
jgi:hypothetical protein